MANKANESLYGFSVFNQAGFISNSGAPGGDGDLQDSMTKGSLYLRTDTGDTYLKINTANATADWVLLPKLDNNLNLTLSKNLTVDSTTLFVDSTNHRVGIGITSPSTIFHVSGAAPAITLTNTSGTTKNWQIRNSVFGGSGSGYFDIYNATTSKTMFAITNGGEVRIGSDVNVGGVGNASRVFIFGGNNGCNIDLMGDSSITGADQVNVELEGSDYSTLPNSFSMRYFGPTALGTTHGTTNHYLGLLQWLETSAAMIDISNTTPLQFFINGSEIIRLTSDGYLGVGTNDPGVLLDLGTAGTIGGVIRFAGSTSGNITLQPNAVAGSSIIQTLPAMTGNIMVRKDDAGIVADGDTITVDWTICDSYKITLPCGDTHINSAFILEFTDPVEPKFLTLTLYQPTCGGGNLPTHLANCTFPSLYYKGIGSSDLFPEMIQDAYFTMNFWWNGSFYILISINAQNYYDIPDFTGTGNGSGLVSDPNSNSAVLSGSGWRDAYAATEALSTGILKSTTATGVLSIASASDFPILNQNTTGTAASATNFSGSLSGDVTGTQSATALANTANVQSIIRSNRLDQMAAPNATVSWNNQALNNLGDTTLSTGVLKLGTKGILHASENNIGTVTTTTTVNWGTSTNQRFTTTSGSACTISFTAPSTPGLLLLKVIAPTSGTASGLTWPTVKTTTALGTTQTLNTSSQYLFYYDGTSYWVLSMVEHK